MSISAFFVLFSLKSQYFLNKLFHVDENVIDQV